MRRKTCRILQKLGKGISFFCNFLVVVFFAGSIASTCMNAGQLKITEYPGLEGIHRDHRVQCLYLCSVALCLTIARYTGQCDKGYLETFKWLFLVGGQHPQV